jgi:hypothetical protein
MGSSFTGGLPAVATAATMHHAHYERGEQPDFPHAEPYAIPRSDAIERWLGFSLSGCIPARQQE